MQARIARTQVMQLNIRMYCDALCKKRKAASTREKSRAEVEDNRWPLYIAHKSSIILLGDEMVL